jgi:uncharacterized OsmC-like protein
MAEDFLLAAVAGAVSDTANIIAESKNIPRVIYMNVIISNER